MISNIISKEFHSINNKINILWTSPESGYFEDLIKEACGSVSLIDFDKTYYGIYDIHIIICNNRLLNFEKCMELSKFFHVPLLIVDHSPKSNMINSDFVMDKIFNPIYQIATSQEIFLSWGKIHDLVLSYDTSRESLDKWKNIIFQLIKTRFIVQEKANAKNQN